MKAYTKYIIGVTVATAAVVLLTWRVKAARVAIDFIGVREIGDNQGWSNKVFEQMMKTVGWKSGEAWCMYLVKAVYMSAFPKRAGKINKVLSGSTQGSWKAAKESDVFKVITTGQPNPGDIVIWQDVRNPSLGHAGIADRRKSGVDWYIIEGNTSLSGVREGQGVMNQVRIMEPGVVQGNLKLLGYLRIKLF